MKENNMNTIKSAVFDLEGDDLDLINDINRKYVSTGLTYGWKANNNRSYDQGHWNKLIVPNSTRFPCDHNQTSYLNNHPEIKNIWGILQATVGSRGFYRTYINGYTYGTEGYAHQDDVWIKEKYGSTALSETAVIYLNNKWHIDWGGETVIYSDMKIDNADNEIVVSVLPKMGRIFIFESTALHAARPLSRSCPDLRSVLVIKTIDPSVVSPLVNFISDLTFKVKHSGKSFFEHLFGTMLNIEHKNRNVSDDVLLAGLYHSVYGTEYFNYNNPEITREIIQKMLGEYSEYLVYEFCNMKYRVNTLMTNSNDYYPKALKDLIMIEIANLEDQNSNFVFDTQIKELRKKLSTIII